MKELQHLNRYFIKYRWRLIFGLLITIIARIFALLTPKFIGDSVDIVEKYINGDILELAEVESELLTNILLILGTTLLA
jgi:ATP-binding cassette subfamily B multidrug efflux pump